MGRDHPPAPGPGPDRVRRQLTVRGRVQMVGFRVFAARVAEQHGVGGWVRNTDAGEVEAVVEGPADAVDRVERRIARGPAAAEVTQVERRDLPIDSPLTTFRVVG